MLGGRILFLCLPRGDRSCHAIAPSLADRGGGLLSYLASSAPGRCRGAMALDVAELAFSRRGAYRESLGMELVQALDVDHLGRSVGVYREILGMELV